MMIGYDGGVMVCVPKYMILNAISVEFNNVLNSGLT
jgi:hypothetical protein